MKKILPNTSGLAPSSSIHSTASENLPSTQETQTSSATSLATPQTTTSPSPVTERQGTASEQIDAHSNRDDEEILPDPKKKRTEVPRDESLPASHTIAPSTPVNVVHTPNVKAESQDDQGVSAGVETFTQSSGVHVTSRRQWEKARKKKQLLNQLEQLQIKQQLMALEEDDYGE